MDIHPFDTTSAKFYFLNQASPIDASPWRGMQTAALACTKGCLYTQALAQLPESIINSNVTSRKW